MIDRRNFLQAMAGVAAAGVAGCTPYLPDGADPSLAASAYSPSADEKYRIPRTNMEIVPREYHRQVVRYEGGEPVGTIVVDTRERFLYLVQPNRVAIRYGIGVGREGFDWKGRARVGRKAKWPNWTPPREMVAREPWLQKYAGGMAGGVGNPLGARALYLYQGGRDTLYRLHGTYQPQSIGRAVSSGCIRLLNQDVADLYERSKIGTPVVVI